MTRSRGAPVSKNASMFSRTRPAIAIRLGPECFSDGPRLCFKHIQTSRKKAAFLQRREQRPLVYDWSPGDVDQYRRGLHLLDGRRINQMVGFIL